MKTIGWLTAAILVFSCISVSAEPFREAPEGYTIVAEDDCGSLERSVRVVRGKDYVFPESMVSSATEYQDIIFDEQFCLLRYKKLNPQAAYKVDVVYVTQQGGERVQRLEADGHVLHDAMPLPVTTPGRFLFDLPSEAYADGQVELKAVNVKGANAVICYLRIWSTDPKRLPGSGTFWIPKGPIEKDWVRQDRMRGKPRFVEWEDPAAEVSQSVAPCIEEQLQRGGKILADLRRMDAPELAAHVAAMHEVSAQRDRLLSENNVDPQAWLKVYLDARWAVRRLAFANPLLDCDGLLFVRRHHPHAMHQCARRLGAFTYPGGEICVLDEMRADGQGSVRSLSAGKFPEGTFGRPDLSFDGKRIVFGYAEKREGEAAKLGYGNITQLKAADYATHQIGPCHEFQCFEMALSGDSQPRQFTYGPFENADPLYLADGRIAFLSHSPGGLVQCGDWAIAYCLFTMNPDGSDMKQITVSKDGEWDPFLLEDGTIGFTRWEYVMKFWSPIQMLWSVRPDGTNPRMIYGSDLSRQYAYPLNYAAPRVIPGTGKIVCIGSAHHNTGAGPVCIVDMDIGPNVAEGLKRITPVRFFETPENLPHAGWYDCPYPLSENYFLVSYTFSANETDTRGYALYLLDTYGGKELIYRDDKLSALFPIPIQPRSRPGAMVEVAAEEDSFGEFMIQDVHEGLAEADRGKARYLQVVEAHERHVHTLHWAMEVGPDSGFETKTVLGTVPIESDGSAYFRVAAGKSVFFSVLDENHRALHTMRSVTNVQPNERTACIGCHEPMRQAPANRPALAAMRPPSSIEPPPWGAVPMDYEALVQPMLDKHCIGCHDGSTAEGKSFDLSKQTRQDFMSSQIPQSYHNLRKYVRHAPIFTYHLSPGTFGSRVSRLPDILAKGHYEVKLSPAEQWLITAWIDCNAPYVGDFQELAVETAAVEE